MADAIELITNAFFTGIGVSLGNFFTYKLFLRKIDKVEDKIKGGALKNPQNYQK